LGMATLILSFGLVFAGCDSGGGSGGGGAGGEFTLTGIPATYNDNFAVLMVQAEGNIMGVNNVTGPGAATLPRISNGRVTVRMWHGYGQPSRWTGTETLDVMVMIFSEGNITPAGLPPLVGERMFERVEFDNGNATVAWADEEGAGTGPGTQVIAEAYRGPWECRRGEDGNIYLTANSIYIGTSATGTPAITGVSTMTAHGMTQLMHGGSSIGTIQPGDFNITPSAPQASGLRDTEWVRPETES